MVSLHKALAMSPKKESPTDFDASQKKRKLEESPLSNQEFFKDLTHDLGKRKSIFDIELYLKTPLPSDKWQQYLTVQSGQIQLCNTKMNMKTQESKREYPLPEKSSLGHLSLDLELNLTCETLKKKEESYFEKKNNLVNESISKNKKDSSFLSTTSSWLSSSSSDGDDYKEMIATVCMKCHMLVMLCKSSPSCPNCKFMHPPPDQNPSKFLKRTRFSFLT